MDRLANAMLPDEQSFPFSFLAPDTMLSTNGDFLVIRALNHAGQVLTIGMTRMQVPVMQQYINVIWGQGGVMDLLEGEVNGHG